MYLPKHHEETRIAVMHALVRSHPLGTWVTQQNGDLMADHVPFLLDESLGDYGMLTAHVARANPVWRSISSDKDSLVIFQGAQTYITPSWYPGKHEHGKVVPTWNYAVVHAHGTPRVIEDREWLLNHVSHLTDTHEANRVQPWKMSDAPMDFIERLVEAIVGIEIPITKLVGKWKVSQNRPEQDKRGVIEGLIKQGDEQSNEMAALVKMNT
jgi:transcriptional regulator